MANQIYNNGLGYSAAPPSSFTDRFSSQPILAATFPKSDFAGGDGTSAVPWSGFSVTSAVDPGMISDVRRLAEGNMPKLTYNDSLFHSIGKGDSVRDHQESILVNRQIIDGQSIRRTEQVTQGKKDTALIVGIPYSSLLGTSNSQNQHDEAGTKHEAFFSIPRVEITDDLITPSSNEPHSKASVLPFEKNCPVWKYIDLEVMPKLRQQPHFRPLEQFPEVQREGIAVGLMVTFQYLSSNKGCLKMDSSCHDLDGYLKRIIDLEEHGFDVQNFRAHLEKLVRVRSDREQLLQKKSETKKEILEGAEKRAQLNVELEAADESVVALKQALHLLQRRKTSLLIQKEESETMIANLHRDLRLAEEQLESSEHTFLDLLTGVP